MYSFKIIKVHVLKQGELSCDIPHGKTASMLFQYLFHYYWTYSPQLYIFGLGFKACGGAGGRTGGPFGWPGFAIGTGGGTFSFCPKVLAGLETGTGGGAVLGFTGFTALTPNDWRDVSGLGEATTYCGLEYPTLVC